jgi:hypothetical protein
VSLVVKHTRKFTFVASINVKGTSGTVGGPKEEVGKMATLDSIKKETRQARQIKAIIIKKC